MNRTIRRCLGTVLLVFPIILPLSPALTSGTRPDEADHAERVNFARLMIELGNPHEK